MITAVTTYIQYQPFALPSRSTHAALLMECECCASFISTFGQCSEMQDFKIGEGGKYRPIYSLLPFSHICLSNQDWRSDRNLQTSVRKASFSEVAITDVGEQQYNQN